MATTAQRDVLLALHIHGESVGIIDLASDINTPVEKVIIALINLIQLECVRQVEYVAPVGGNIYMEYEITEHGENLLAAPEVAWHTKVRGI